MQELLKLIYFEGYIEEQTELYTIEAKMQIDLFTLIHLSDDFACSATNRASFWLHVTFSAHNETTQMQHTRLVTSQAVVPRDESPGQFHPSNTSPL